LEQKLHSKHLINKRYETEKFTIRNRRLCRPAFSIASCSDYLDISGEFNASLGVDQVWDNATYTRNWYGVIYRNLMEYSETGSEVNAFKNPWSNLCGEIASEKASSRDVMMAGFTAASGSYHRWDYFLQRAYARL